MIAHLATYFHDLVAEATAHPIVIIGLVGQMIFMSRMIVQWIASERARRSVVPVSFWYLSLAGSILVLAYGFVDKDAVVILGQAFGFIVYVRNIYLIHTHQSRQQETAA